MTKKNAASLLTSVDELFTTEQEREQAARESVVLLDPADIADFPNHPFKVVEDEAMLEMAESVREYGVLVPVLVRPRLDGGWEMVSGHRRKAAAILAGVSEIPCIVRNMTDDEAVIVMVDSNLQREKILPSEKAFAYKMKLDAMKRQGQRTDLTLSPMATRLDTATLIGKQSGESRDQVFRYVRLTNLIPELLEMVDAEKIKLRPAVELSYLNTEEQGELLAAIASEDCTPSHAQAIKMREYATAGRLNADVILSIMQEEKPNQVEQFKIPKARIARFFPTGATAKTMEEVIVKALEMYRRRQRDKAR